jgi:hypothetical protein
MSSVLEADLENEAAAPRREVIHGDAVGWLALHEGQREASVITSIPDVSEVGTSLGAWLELFAAAARACLAAAAADGLCVFFQTDIKREGRWISKAGLVMRAAAELEVPLLFHKIVCRRPPGSIVAGRPGFSHLLGFSREAIDDPGRATADVLPDLGDMPWSHSMGTRAAEAAVLAVRRLAPTTRRVIAPFCGIGTALAVANAYGLDAVGIERNRKRAAAARRFSWTRGGAPT